MDEVDGILIYTLKHIGCEIGSKIAELTPPQLIQCATKCLEISRPDLDVPHFDVSVSMSARYKVASQVAQAITELGYQDEIGCQSFLYPTEAETRKVLIFLVEKLPRDSEIVGDQIENLLSKLAKDKDKKAAEEEEEEGRYSNGVDFEGIRLPAAVDVDSLPKETLKFYASHMAELSFVKIREQYRKKEEPTEEVKPIAEPEEEDDFGDPDVDIPLPTEKPQIPQKPKIKPKIPEKPSQALKDNKNEEKAAEEAVAEHIRNLQDNAKKKAKLIKKKEKVAHSLEERLLELQREIDQANAAIDEQAKLLARLQKTDQLLSGDDNALEKVKNAVNAQVEKLMGLSEQWEKHRKPLVEEIHTKRAANETSDATKIRDEVLRLKAKMREMGQEAKMKESLYNQLLIDYDKLPKDLSRSSYTRRIGEIIGNIKKQKKEIAKVLEDTKEIQKDINTLTGRVERTFAVADELIYKVADKDKNVAQSYKLLVTIHSDFSRIIKSLEEIGNLKRQQRDFEDKLEFEKGRSIADKLNRLKADMTQMQHENRVLEAKLRDPTLPRNKKKQPES